MCKFGQNFRLGKKSVCDLVKVDNIAGLLNKDGSDHIIVSLHESVEFTVEFDRGNVEAIWFRQQQPVSVLALKDLEIIVEEGLELRKLLVVAHLSLSEVGSVDQVV